MRQVLFRIPIGDEGIPVYGFGVMLFLAYVACIWVARRRAAKLNIESTVIEDLALWIFIGGILGARICYLILHRGLRNLSGPGDFLIRLVAIWDGGIIFYGAVIGATISYFIGRHFTFRHRANVTTLRLADIIAPTVAIGLLLGRVGCLLNGCCYGQVSCSSWDAIGYPMSAPARYELTSFGWQTPAGFLIDEESATVLHLDPDSAAKDAGLQVKDRIVRVNGHEVKDRIVEIDGKRMPQSSSFQVAERLTADWPRGESNLTLTVDRKGKEVEIGPFAPKTIELLPTQVYESISMILVLLLLLAFDSVKTRHGQGMSLMMIAYGIHRFVNEILRIDQRPVGFERYISVVLVVGGIGLYTWVTWRKNPEPL